MGEYAAVYEFALGSTSLQTLTRSKFQHVIARSVATWQSVLLAVQHRRKQYFRRIRKILRIRPKAHLSLPFPAGTRIATPVCALVRNDMQKTGTRQRVQGGGTRGKVRRRWQFCLVQRPCLCGHAACFCMSLRGAQRRGNPFSLQHSITESSTLGEYEKMLRIRPNISQFARHFCGDADCHTSVRTGSQ